MKPEIVSESKAISEIFGIPKIPKSSTSEFPKDKATIRCHALRNRVNAGLTLYYKGNGVRTSFFDYTDNGTEPHICISGTFPLEEFEPLIETIREVMEKRKALAG